MSAATLFVLAVVIAGLVLLIVVMNQERARDNAPHQQDTGHQRDVAACVEHLRPQERTIPVVAHCRAHPFDPIARGAP